MSEQLEDILDDLASQLNRRTFVAGSIDFDPEECFILRVVDVATSELRMARSTIKKWVQDCDEALARAEKAEAEVERLRGALADVLEVAVPSITDDAHARFDKARAVLKGGER
jgi:hypothetical protein